jgi:hypothetical protein
VVRPAFAVQAAPHLADLEAEGQDGVLTCNMWGETPRLGAAQASRRRYSAARFFGQGLHPNQHGDGWGGACSLETPFGAWSVSNLTHLATDLLLFQLGDSQICLYDPGTHRLALVARGRGPVVVVEAPPAPPD